MKLRNKKTGEIGWLYCDHISVPKKMTVFSEDKDLSANHWDYTSLAELNAEWCDYEEPKEFWFIGEDCCPHRETFEVTKDFVDRLKEIGNYFETEEEAEKAVKKLKAWKRLKENNLSIEKAERTFVNTDDVFTLQDVTFRTDTYGEIEHDLNLLFGGEE